MLERILAAAEATVRRTRPNKWVYLAAKATAAVCVAAVVLALLMAKPKQLVGPNDPAVPVSTEEGFYYRHAEKPTPNPTWEPMEQKLSSEEPEMLYYYYCFVCPHCGWRQPHHGKCDSCRKNVPKDTIIEKWLGTSYANANSNKYDLRTNYKNIGYKRYVLVDGIRFYYDIRPESQMKSLKDALPDYEDED